MLYIYSNLLALFLYYVFCHLLFKKKKINGIVIFTIYFISFIIKYVINSFNSPQLNIIYSISLYFLIAFICYEDNFIYKTLLILGYFTLSIISESINFIIFNDFIKNYSFYIQIFFSKCLLFILLILISQLKKIKEDNLDFKSMISLIIQPLIIIILLYLTNGNISTKTNNNIILTITLILLLFSNLASFYIINEIIIKKKIEEELLWKIENEKNNREYYTQMKKSLELYKSFKHDWQHHLNIMYSMTQQNKITELNNYISKISDNINVMHYLSSGDEFLDLILLTKISKIHNTKINMIYEIRNINIEFISKIDLNIIYSNIIDNAITSCSQSKNRFIKIQTKEENNRYQIIKITNSCEKINLDLSTLKPDKENHGIGLKNVRKVVQKYHGFLNFNYQENDKSFVTTIIFDKEKNF
ncbi:sensor histidine kinase [Thomasclavelia spiroformis]|uniref:sensor histidine kinase n=1 Tax=Thomasclavelia spiroformis TaxID=29348 RepID=UPI00241C507A|nr:GHKL domain-containing protein [Thomasclavelia spiroformis]